MIFDFRFLHPRQWRVEWIGNVNGGAPSTRAPCPQRLALALPLVAPFSKGSGWAWHQFIALSKCWA